MIYTINDYRTEMLEFKKHLPDSKIPTNWIAEIISNHFPDLSKQDRQYASIKAEINNTSRGNSHELGIRKGYINMIRLLQANHTDKEYEELPERVYLW